MSTAAVLPVLAGLGTALAVLAAVPLLPGTAVAGPGRAPGPDPGRADRADRAVPDPGTLRRHRTPVTVLAGVGVWVLVGGTPGAVLGLLAAAVARLVIDRSEPPHLRRRRELVLRDLPQVVALLGAALRGGAAVPEATRWVAAALPGAAAERLAGVQARLAVGVDPGAVWRGLADDPELGPLGRALARAHRSGTSVVSAVEPLADELAERARSETEDRARAVGVKAAVPLGLCLLPAFVLIGIVPLVAGLATTLAW